MTHFSWHVENALGLKNSQILYDIPQLLCPNQHLIHRFYSLYPYCPHFLPYIFFGIEQFFLAAL